MIDHAGTYAYDDPLSAARGIMFGSILSLMFWGLILAAAGQLS